jgi:hypothetical protein
MAAMDRRRSPLTMRLAFADPEAGGMRTLRRHSTHRRPAPATLNAMVIGALVWLLLGCSGLLWVIAFTSDPDSLVLALAVWVLAFVGPSLMATSLAYRLDDEELAESNAADERRRH